MPEKELLQWTIYNAIWTRNIAIGTIVYSVFFILTAIFAILTYYNSRKKNKIDIASELFGEFINLHLQIFENLSYEKYDEKKDEKTNKDSYRLILFLSKLGSFLKDKKISIEEIKLFFYSYLFYRDSILILVDNLRLYNPKLLEDIRDNLNYLFNSIGKYSGIKKYNDLIKNKFEIFTQTEVAKILSGVLSIKEKIIYKVIPESEDYKKKASSLLTELNEEYRLVERVKDEFIETINEKYLKKIIGLSYSIKIEILEIIRNSLERNKSHGKIREWKRLCAGLIILMNSTDLKDINKKMSADMIVRISRWRHSTGNIWKGFNTFICDIVKKIWGDIENLYNRYSRF